MSFLGKLTLIYTYMLKYPHYCEKAYAIATCNEPQLACMNK